MTNSNQISDLASGTKLDLLVAEIQGTVTVKKLRTRGPRKGELWNNDSQGNNRGGNKVDHDGIAVVTTRACGARHGTITPARGQGREMVDNLSGVVRNANRVYEADRKAAAVARRVEVAARKEAALDELLAETQG